MPELTDRQRRLLNLFNQLSQNTTEAATNSNLTIQFPEIGVDLGSISVGGNPLDPITPTPTPAGPATIRQVLQSLVNEQVEVTTPFGPVSGTMLAVRDDYIVLVESTGAQVLVRIENIELVNEL
ncbi:DUF2642 domain-containing protein [Oceanobacillus massiliensis]|uniref:DUF2642 domain-containing protein n=1 Tax=Oceanobacillus massiliensis TaxID=1465765 RepID=UPI0002889EE3|nr:DUF2642 domain-containing protein [Oceanobacillus massiliensis]